jgi:hypothetical protein
MAYAPFHLHKPQQRGNPHQVCGSTCQFFARRPLGRRRPTNPGAFPNAAVKIFDPRPEAQTGRIAHAFRPPATPAGKPGCDIGEPEFRAATQTGWYHCRLRAVYYHIVCRDQTRQHGPVQRPGPTLSAAPERRSSGHALRMTNVSVSHRAVPIP